MAYEALDRLMDSLPGEGVPGAALTVWRAHREIYRREVGESDAARAMKVSPEDYYWVYSATKVVVCAAALTLWEQGKLDLDAPVARYLPAWGAACVRDGETLRTLKHPITVRHLFAMQGGLDYNFESEPITRAQAVYGEQASTRQIVDAIAQSPLCFDPGEHFQYSFCHDVLGAVIEAVSGMGLEAYLRARIFEPCGMTTATFHPTASQMARMSAQYRWDADAALARPCGQGNTVALSDAYESGGAGLACRVDDYIRFADAMACGGVACTGQRILAASTIDMMRTNLQIGACLEDFHKLRRSYGYGLGVRTRMDHEDGGLPPLGEFGWDGAACCYALMDPANELSLFFAMHVLDYARGYAVTHPALRDAVYRACGLG